MPFRDVLKKAHLGGKGTEAPTPAAPAPAPAAAEPPEFTAPTLIRSDTAGQEILYPPSTTEPSASQAAPTRPPLGRSGSSVSSSARSARSDAGGSPPTARREKRLSALLHLGGRSRSRSTSQGSSAARAGGDADGAGASSSAHVPADLPDVAERAGDGAEDREARWEKRATMLAQGTLNLGSPIAAEFGAEARGPAPGTAGDGAARPGLARTISDAKSDDDIQNAIRLHEAGDLAASTEMFGRLANPNGQNNALAQVLYGLALRHGWGVPVDTARAVTYLSAAATNSAAVEAAALASGLKKGGAAKGELVLALYELANCFRHGWGVARDPAAARSYYETAANLGDADAMAEAARCYEEGFGGKKDKFMAARYYRLAEGKGNKILGNSWIWKEKYDSPA